MVAPGQHLGMAFSSVWARARHALRVERDAVARAACWTGGKAGGRPVGAHKCQVRRPSSCLSGGLDSATALAIAIAEGYRPHALSFRYGQRHDVEIAAARKVAASMRVPAHVVLDIDLRPFGGSALTSDIAVPHHDSVDDLGPGIPVTYVPARNTVFLSFALAWAETLGSSDIFIGVNAIDYSGYPDCRPEYLAAYEAMANLATKAGVEGRQRLRRACPAGPSDQSPDHPAGPRSWRRLLPHAQLLRPERRWPAVRDLRLMSLAP